jgi:hypothetical protein
LSVHPEAIANINEKANQLLEQVVRTPVKPSSSSTEFSPERNTCTIPPEAIRGIVKKQTTLFSGGKKSGLILHQGDSPTQIEILGETYQNMVRLSEQIQKQKDLNGLSHTSTDELIIDWIVGKLDHEISVSLFDFLLVKYKELVAEHEVWMPVNMLFVEKEFSIGNITIKTISPAMIDLFVGKIDNAEARKKYAAIKGMAAAVTTVSAEPQKAKEIAYGECEKAIAALRLYSPILASPHHISYCDFSGSVQLPTRQILFVKNNEIKSREEHRIDPRYDPDFKLDNKKIDEIMSDGLSVIGEILGNKDCRTDFEQKYLDALLLYSRSSLMTEPAEKMIYIFAAVESLLLRNDQEVIVTNIAERIAFIIGQSLQDRKEIISNVKETYGIRSKFVHHGAMPKDLAILKKFMIKVYLLFLCLPNKLYLYPTKEQFLDSIEDRKLS